MSERRQAACIMRAFCSAPVRAFRSEHDNEVVKVQQPLETELAHTLVSALNLEDVSAETIDPLAPLFGGPLGLDSIDALELALAISKQYGFELRSDDANNRQIFSSLRSLAAHVAANRTR